MGVVRMYRWCCCNVRRYMYIYIDILIKIITFPYSTCISSYLAAASCSFLKCFFVLVYVIFVRYSKRCSKNIRDRSKIDFTRIIIINYIERTSTVRARASPETSIPRARNYVRVIFQECDNGVVEASPRHVSI